MFNLLVGLNDQSVFDTHRFLEYTEDNIRGEFTNQHGNLVQRIKELPALVMPEPQDTSSEQLAYVGHIVNFSYGSKQIAFDFVADTSIDPIPTDLIVESAHRFRIEAWELNRTHWAIKDGNVYKAIVQTLTKSNEPFTSLSKEPKSGKIDTQEAHVTGLLRFPVDKNPVAGQIAVMMPFDSEFDDVYTTIQNAGQHLGMTCRRVDELSSTSAIMDDIAELLWTSETVIADMTGMNPNVFYETGIAHTLKRKTVLLTQDTSDIPFDLKHIRHLEYSDKGLGLQRLQDQLVKTLREIA